MNKIRLMFTVLLSLILLNTSFAGLIPLGDHQEIGDSITSEDPTALDRRISDLDQKIREREKIALPEDPVLKKLVEDYNQAVEMKSKKVENFHDQSEKISSLEKRIEQLEALIAEKRVGSAEVSSNEKTLTDVDKKKHYLDNKATVAAQEISKSVITTSSTSSQDYNLGLKLLGSDNVDDHRKALSIFEEIMNKEPDSKLAHSSHINAGLANLALKDAEKAEAYFKSAIVLPLEDTQIATARLGYARALQIRDHKSECCDQVKLISKFSFTETQQKEFNHLKSVCCVGASTH